MLKYTFLVASLVHVGEFLHVLVFLNQIKSASKLHLPGDKGSVSGMLGAPCTFLGVYCQGHRGAPPLCCG